MLCSYRSITTHLIRTTRDKFPTVGIENVPHAVQSFYILQIFLPQDFVSLNYFFLQVTVYRKVFLEYIILGLIVNSPQSCYWVSLQRFVTPNEQRQVE